MALELSLLASPALAFQAAPPPSRKVDYVRDTGFVENRGSTLGVIATFEVRIPGAVWLRLFFADVTLSGDAPTGTGSILRITSFRDAATQELEFYEVQQWRNSSAYFNGDEVLVEILAHPHTGANRLLLDYVVAGMLPGAETESQCGATDDRVLSSDPRAARLLPIGCTGWIIDDCARCLLTAGHCSDGGFSVVQFNVPLSSSSGAINHPGPEDQYSVDQNSMQFLNNGVGQDWGYFGVFPNATTGLLPALAQGAFFDLELPPTFNASDSIRITGYGSDSTPQTHNYVQQTHLGPWFSSSGTWLEYQTDTEGGNSGSPVIHEQTGTAIGIHTHGGCSGSAGNSGTGSNHSGLVAALANPEGVCGSPIALLADIPTLLQPGVVTTVDLQIAVGSVPGSERLYFRYDGGIFLSADLLPLGNNLFRASLPPAVCGATPEFYFEADALGCGLRTLPIQAPNETFSASVGTTSSVFGDTMESDLGWQGGVAGDNATAGVWVRVNPNGTAAQSEDDHTPTPGELCFVTGQGSVGGSNGQADVDGGKTTLLSPQLDASAATQAHISYWRWYSNDQGASPDDVLLIDVSANNGTNWTNVETLGPTGSDSEGGWIYHSFRIADYVTPTNQVRVRFVASDTGTASIVEAGVDDFELYELHCDDVLADCNGNGILDADDIASGRSLDLNFDGIPDECGGPGTAYCFCLTGAPCGNTSADGGCANSSGLGAQVAASGSASVAADDLVLSATRLPLNQNGIFFMGAGTGQIPFGDGQQCATGGGVGLFRYLPIQNSGASGVLVLGPGVVARSQSFPAQGQIQAGQTWNFQAWFRDPMGPCASGFNTSHGMSVLFGL